MDLDPHLTALRELGGFFVLHTAGDSLDPTPTLAQAYARREEDIYPDSITFRVRTVADHLRTSELRVSASIAQQALAARLWSIALGCAVLYDRVPDLDPRLLHWDAASSAPDDLWLADVRPRAADAATVADLVVRGHLEPLNAALHARYGVAEGLLWGNAGSALAGAARELDRLSRGAGTDAGARAHALAAELFTHPRLAPTGTLIGTAFRRRSCCLYYRVPGGGVCGDCCFTSTPWSSPDATSG
ncbi:(2Fe-2S)-binding protein [Streptomyces sp. ME02-8801-2C]|uniref:(2Fe-2S)-binding protein n=1 Tax=Streptomyces sp. ME02-8801-2C TaxID=3028680 RepID=UPI0029A897B0|nr:(2Fe-2S)-binding protein [Streptomyces sp. ME02-8801-2C]MDX3451896.1 (2Fe-2S)-binding protein [Streptomyces sp. ME02-8801-2C]